MTTDEKLDKISSDLVEVSAMLKMACEVQSRHNSAIYGNGKDGLITRASLTEDNIQKLEETTEKTNEAFDDHKTIFYKLSGRINFHLGKMALLSAIITAIALFIFTQYLKAFGA